MSLSWRNPITVELGSNVIRHYTEKKTFLGPEPKEADLLMQATGQLRDQLFEKGVYLPGIKYMDADDLEPNQFRVDRSLVATTYDIRQQTVTEVLERYAYEYQIAQNPDVETVDKLVATGVSFLQQESYQQAFDAFQKAFYWGLIVDGDTTENFIASVLNLGYIHILNNRSDVAQGCGAIVQELVDAPLFSVPLVKYQAHMFYADTLWMNRQYGDALTMYFSAAQDVKNYPKSKLEQFALWQFICACFQLNWTVESF